jgi:hypothetical protein
MKVYDLHHNVLYSRAFGIADVANTRWRVRYTRQRSVYIRPFTAAPGCSQPFSKAAK